MCITDVLGSFVVQAFNSQGMKNKHNVEIIPKQGQSFFTKKNLLLSKNLSMQKSIEISIEKFLEILNEKSRLIYNL